MVGHSIHWFPLGVAGLLAVLATWLNQITHQPDIRDDGGFAHEPDTIVAKFNALAFDAEGRPLHRLSAEKLTHYLDDDTTELEGPRFSVLDRQRLRSEVMARRGQISTNGQHVHFIGAVHLVRYGRDEGPPATLDTEYLWITPDANLMRTQEPVILRQGGAEIRAGALRADTQSKELTLSGGVRGTYEKTR